MEFESFVQQLMGRGISSELAKRVADRFSDWSELPTKGEEVSGFSKQELALLGKAKSRREIPQATIRRLIDECDFKCCLCWNVDSQSGVIVHHIRSHAEVPDDRYENLVLLCASHHDAVHVKHELTRNPFPPELLSRRKQDFAIAIADFKAGRRTAPGREQNMDATVLTTPPAPPSHVFGRVALLHEVADTLSRPTARVAIVGMGGIGKTTIALKIAEACVPKFPGGILWTEVGAAMNSIADMLRPWLRSLGGDPKGLDAVEQLALFAELLRRRTEAKGDLLLAIDDANEAALEALLSVAKYLPDPVSLLVTTRDTAVAAALGAKVFRVAPLERECCVQLLECICHSASILTEATTVDNLLSQLGHLPLAIELVARQIAIRESKPGFSIAGLCRELESSDLKLLSFPGHRGIAMSFALSYNYLDESQQRIFRSFGIFVTTYANIESIASAAGSPSGETETVLDRLVVVSMLSWGQGAGDYRIHPLLKKYAEFLLERATEEEQAAVRRRFYNYFASRIAKLSKTSPSDHLAVEVAFSDLVKALRYAAEDNAHALVADTVFNLCVEMRFFSTGDFDRQSIPILVAAVNAAKHLHDQQKESAICGHLGTAHARLGEISEAVRCYEDAANVARKIGDDYDLASHLQNLGGVLFSEAKDLSRVERVLHEALNAAERSMNFDATIGCFSTLGSLHRDIGNYIEAARLYKGALEASRLVKNRLSEGNTLSNLGLVVTQLGKAAEGEQMINEALRIAIEVGDRRGEGNRTGHLGGILFDRAKKLPLGVERTCLIEKATEHMVSAMNIARETGDPEKATTWLMNLGNVHLLQGEMQHALTHYQEALQQSQASGFARLEAQASFNLGSALASQGELHSALAHIVHCKELLSKMRSPMAIQMEAYIQRLHEMMKSNG